MSRTSFHDSGPLALAEDPAPIHPPHGFHGLDLTEALRLLSLEGTHIPRADELTALQGVIDGLCALSSRDGLTGLANRRMFNSVLGREIERGVRTGDSCGLLLIDIDHFKQVNDRHGHLAGDRVLSTVAGIIENCFRSIDTVARFGGEEFAVVLPNAPESFLQQAAERVRTMVENARIEAVPGLQISVTVSIGTACTRAHVALAIDKLIEIADRNLYQAKWQGRNRVCCEPVSDVAVSRDERAHILSLCDSPDPLS